MNYYISDLHIGCVNSFDGRTLDYDELLVKNWNSIVNNNDTVYILGDIGRCGNNKDNEYLCSVISRLKGKRILVLGNHDSNGIKDNRIRQLFTNVYDYLEVIDNFNGINQKLVLSHYPIFSWNGCYKDTVLLYGHTHGNFDDQIYQNSLEELRENVKKLNKENPDIKKFKKEPYAYNVGAMMPWINYKPKTYKEIKEGTEKYYD
ncbi:MAG TPA: phosphoesterase [Lachnospiraceae bacterium]|nr:phosphoesterase [Lachnospiraceae bacterium]